MQPPHVTNTDGSFETVPSEEHPTMAWQVDRCFLYRQDHQSKDQIIRTNLFSRSNLSQLLVWVLRQLRFSIYLWDILPWLCFIPQSGWSVSFEQWKNNQWKPHCTSSQILVSFESYSHALQTEKYGFIFSPSMHSSEKLCQIIGSTFWYICYER